MKSPEMLRASRPIRFKILLAEDDADMRMLVADALRRDGHEVVETVDGAEAMASLNVLRRFPGETPDVVVMDVNMPRQSGLEVARAIASTGWSTRVILVTGFGSPSLHEEAGRLGAVVFDKPFDLDVLRTAIHRRRSVRMDATGAAR